MRILITGATGFIGNAVAMRLSEEHEIWCTLRKTSDVLSVKNIKCKILYVDNRDSIYSELEKIKPEMVIHLAGVFLSEHSRKNIGGMIDSNIQFPTILFDAAYEAGCRKYINTGSCWQNYQGDTYNPVNLYAATKQAVEDILKYYVYVGDSKAITLSIFDSYGPNDARRKILNIVAKLNDGEHIDMSGGEQKMYLCYIDDIVNAYIQSIALLEKMEDGEYKKYAVRDEQAYSLKDIITLYLTLSKKNVSVNWGVRAYRNREIMDPSGWGDILPGWKVQYPLKTGMKMYVANNEEKL